MWSEREPRGTLWSTGLSTHSFRPFALVAQSGLKILIHMEE